MCRPWQGLFLLVVVALPKTLLVVVVFGRWDSGTLGLWDDSADIKISREAHHTFHLSPFTFQFPPNAPFARGSPSERSFVRSVWLRKTAKTMGKWDSGTMGRCGRQEEKLFSLSQCLVVSLSWFWTMGKWDSGTMGRRGRQINTASQTPHLSLFTFQFVVLLRTHRSPGGAPPNVRSFVRLAPLFSGAGHLFVQIIFLYNK